MQEAALQPTDGAMQEAAVPQDQADALLQDYSSSKLQALRRGLGIVLIAGLLALPLLRELPNQPLPR